MVIYLFVLGRTEDRKVKLIRNRLDREMMILLPEFSIIPSPKGGSFNEIRRVSLVGVSGLLENFCMRP
jgi:hypothetical protein